MSPQKNSRSAQLAVLDEAIVAAKARVRAVELEQRATAARIEQTTEEIVEAHAQGDDTRADKLRRDRGKLKADSAPREKVAGAQRALARAETDRGVFIGNNLNALLAEIRPDTDAAVVQLREAIEAIAAANTAWAAQEGRVTALLLAAGEPTGTVARLPGDVNDLVRAASRVDAAGIRAPFPEDSAGLRIVPEDHPDPAISAPARRALKEAA